MLCAEYCACALGESSHNMPNYKSLSYRLLRVVSLEWQYQRCLVIVFNIIARVVDSAASYVSLIAINEKKTELSTQQKETVATARNE